MSKFKKKKDGELPPVSTASLPDIVFMLLFFFMTVTVMKDSDLMLVNKLPEADQIQKLDKKDPVIYIYAGKPVLKYQSKFGTGAKIQINDTFVDVKEVAPKVLEYRSGLRQELREIFISALKIDSETNMGLISDLKQELREINALKLMYVTRQGGALGNIP
ncbi:biopolymer transport protein ExbD/TolR [Elysia marginata]|uniref:Biopolymer transport protein ExbD/TolR n=1 Tax=Elysia marginata TaxID=1093978 RepID=A0AAV4I2I7_9GAST|nr:biopolymer transport protein ExbD/TolR [Elysia marginata]